MTDGPFTEAKELSGGLTHANDYAITFSWAAPFMLLDGPTESALRIRQVDERLLIEAAQKNPSGFADLYEANFARVYAYVAQRVGTREETEDITADVFQRALKNIGRFQWRGAPFAAWLFRIAANTISDRRQRTGREQADPAPEPVDESAGQEIERRAMLFELVEGLPDDQRQVIVQRFMEQRSIREIAQMMERSEGAVKQLQFRALRQLRTRIGGRDA